MEMEMNNRQDTAEEYEQRESPIGTYYEVKVIKRSIMGGAGGAQSSME